MTFDQMKQLVEVYRSGSINRAAQTLFMTQSALSKSIGALEKELGKEVLVRSYTGTSLTPFGEEILRYAQDMLRSEEAIRMLARENSLKRQLNLRVSAARLRFSAYAFLQIAGRHIHESVRVHHIQDSISGVVFDVMNRESEVGLIYISNHTTRKVIQVLHNSGLVYHPVQRFSPTLLIPENHPLYGRQWQTIPIEVLRQFALRVPAEEIDVFRDMQHEVAAMLGISRVVEEEVNGSHQFGDPLPDGEPEPLSLAVSNGVYERIGLEVPHALQMRQAALPPIPFEFEVGWITQSKNQLSPMAQEYIDEIRLLCAQLSDSARQP